MGQPSSVELDNRAADAAKEREGKIKKYLGQFDELIIGLIAATLALAALYGITAGPRFASPGKVVTTSRVSQQAQPIPIQQRPNPLNKDEAGAPAGSGVPVANTANPPGENVAGGRNATTAGTSLCPPGCNELTPRLTTGLLALAIALAALAIGAFIGFLFGLPRTLTSGEARGEARSDAALAASQDGADANATLAPTRLGPSGPAPGVAVNTNLEQISDWLTKIIVGVGLTKLESVPERLDHFGTNVDAYFGYGGKIFGIGGGLFFLIAGFFLSYVGTRVKLSLVFVGSQRDNFRTAEPTKQEAADVVLSSETSAVDTSSLASQPNDELKKADAEMLSRSLTDLKTPEERAAYANAAARQGKKELAIDIMTDLVKERPHDQKILSDYAGVLALLGDPRVEDVLATIRTTDPAAEADAQDKVNIAILRSGLYDGGYEASIDAGEALLGRPIAERDAWIHLWLACAYGQRYRALKASGSAPALKATHDRVLAEVKKTLAIDPALKDFVATLYDPARSNGVDNDLQSLFPDEEMDRLLDI